MAGPIRRPAVARRSLPQTRTFSGPSSEVLENAVVAVRDQFGWGPRKIVAYLRTRNEAAPPVRTAAAILLRHGRSAEPPAPDTAELQRFERPQPNQLRQIDFKGYVEVERRKVYPLTVLDDHSRFLLALVCGHDVTMARAWNALGLFAGSLKRATTNPKLRHNPDP